MGKLGTEFCGHHTAVSLGVVGFGAFGKLVVGALDGYFDVMVCDPTYVGAVLEDGRSFVMGDLEQIAACDVVVLAVPVARMAHVCAALAPMLKPGSMVIDVGSVKITPMKLMAKHLPAHVEILGTHPLFGPQSSKDGLQGRKIALCPLRGTRWRSAARFLRNLGLEVLVTTAEAHDREAATVQGLTHLIAKVMTDMGPMPQRLTTASFDLLCEAVGMVRDDPPTVLHAIEAANPFAAEVRAAFFERADVLRAQFEQT